MKNLLCYCSILFLCFLFFPSCNDPFSISPVPEAEKPLYNERNKVHFPKEFPDLKCVDGFRVDVGLFTKMLSDLGLDTSPKDTTFKIHLYSTLDPEGIYGIAFIGEIPTIKEGNPATELLLDNHFYKVNCDNTDLQEISDQKQKDQLIEDIIRFKTDVTESKKLMEMSHGISAQKALKMLTKLKINTAPIGAKFHFALRFYPAYDPSKNRLFYMVKGETVQNSGQATIHELSDYYDQMDPCPSACPWNDIIH